MSFSAAFLIVQLLRLGGVVGKSASELSLAHSLIMYSIRLHAASFDVALVLFGAHLVLVGVLTARSTFLPRLLGAALGFAGACYIANSFIEFVAPALASVLFPLILLPGFLAEAGLTLRLLIVGVDPRRWIAACKVVEAR